MEPREIEMEETLNSVFVIVGGGIAGVSCAETLAFLCPDESITLITESSLIKAVTNLVPLAKSLSKFDIEERNIHTINKKVKVIVDNLTSINADSKIVTMERGTSIKYQYLCLCTGARPKLIDNNNDFVIGIRDTESVNEFQRRIKNARKIALVGNGGIASEVAYEIKNIEVDWIVKDEHISSTFVDPAAAKFFQTRLHNKDTISIETSPTVKRMRYSDEASDRNMEKGAALGPDWHRLIDISGSFGSVPSTVKIHYNVEVKNIERIRRDSVRVTLTNDEIIDCDFVVSATGVVPSMNYTCNQEFKLGPDGGIFVNELMETSIPNIYAAGDVCYAGWEKAEQWFQMRLWTQARQMGAMAGKSMAGAFNKEPVLQDFCFELFGHVTKLFGYQVVLLGKYNGQGLGTNYEMLVRVTPEKEYIKFILVDGRLQGAILIGETGLEETCENLILNQLDLTPYGDDILDPNIDIEDYFD